MNILQVSFHVFFWQLRAFGGRSVGFYSEFIKECVPCPPCAPHIPFVSCVPYLPCVPCVLSRRRRHQKLTTEGRPKVDPRWSTLIWSRTATDRRSCLRTSTNLVHIYILYIYKSHQCSNFNQSINVPILISGRGATFISDDIFTNCKLCPLLAAY